MEEILDVGALLRKDVQIQTTNGDQEKQSITAPIVDLDVGNLAAYCYQERPQGVSLDDWARESMQLLVESVFNLPTTKSNRGPVAKLPDPTTDIPREKPYPTEKPATKWEKYRKDKGIKSRKKSSQVWDEGAQAWKYQYGFKRKNDDRMDWAVEDNPEQLARAGVEDPFLLRKRERKDRIDKNKKKEKANKIAAARKNDKSMVPGVIGITNKARNDKVDLHRALSFAQKSTASLGHFDNKMGDEPTIKRKPKILPVTGNTRVEHKANMKIVNKITKRKFGEIEMDKAVNQNIALEQQRKRRRTK